MKNKILKVTLFLIISFFSYSAFSQNSAATANKNTALRCLKNAENCLYAGDYKNALNQAALGLSYDDSISDLLYVQAAAMINSEFKIFEVLPIIENAFKKNNWSGYSKTGARILYADLLSDTGKYYESLKVLDDDEALFSADAEFIRIKNYYRIGTEETLNSARQRINSARRVYPADERFPNIFFLFEYEFLSRAERQNQKYIIPALVKTIASSYISNLPDYSGNQLDMEILAAFFAEGEEQLRLVKAIDAKNQTKSPLLAIIALKTGLYTQMQAFDFFVNAAGSNMSFENLASLCLLLTDEDSRQAMAELLANFNGVISIDEDCNLISELTISYETGRPSNIKYDRNNDGLLEQFTICDFGLPSLMYLDGNSTQISFSAYPLVSKIGFSDTNLSFSFLQGDYELNPYEFIIEPVFSRFGVSFYIPYINSEFEFSRDFEFTKKASAVEVTVSERENARVVFTSQEGNLLFARHYEGDFNYAYCDFTKGMPFIRYVDYNNDGYFETSEFYDSIFDEYGNKIYSDSNSFIEEIFGPAFSSESVYLKKVAIDSNANTNAEFSEQYLDKGGKITLWDNDDNGIPDCQYIKYPLEDDGLLKEEAIFFNSNGLQLANVQSINSKPVKCTIAGENNSDQKEVIVLAGEYENFYWLDVKGAPEDEEFVKKNYPNGLEQGQVHVVQTENHRFSVIRVSQNYFCMIKPDSFIPDEEQSDENNSEKASEHANIKEG
ncbi:MAG: hypothetical protein PUC37_07505 [Spirochaetales bacterium]|nr:hypothetical protein [Spirochaetales bacterium]